MTFAEKQQLEGKPAGTTTLALASPQQSATVSGDVDYEFYTVRNGDTVWDIAKKFNGVSANDILSLNNISDASRIMVGQKLRIRKKS